METPWRKYEIWVKPTELGATDIAFAAGFEILLDAHVFNQIADLNPELAEARAEFKVFAGEELRVHHPMSEK